MRTVSSLLADTIFSDRARKPAWAAVVGLRGDNRVAPRAQGRPPAHPAAPEAAGGVTARDRRERTRAFVHCANCKEEGPCGLEAGLDEGLLSFSIPVLAHMDHPYCYKKYQ